MSGGVQGMARRRTNSERLRDNISEREARLPLVPFGKGFTMGTCIDADIDMRVR